MTITGPAGIALAAAGCVNGATPNVLICTVPAGQSPTFNVTVAGVQRAPAAPAPQAAVAPAARPAAQAAAVAPAQRPAAAPAQALPRTGTGLSADNGLSLAVLAGVAMLLMGVSGAAFATRRVRR